MSASRDWLPVASPVNAEGGRVLATTPWAIAVEVAHRSIQYGEFIEQMQDGYIHRLLKRAVFCAVRDAITEHSRGAS